MSRELFELVCVQLFDPQYELFMRFKDDPQALVSYYRGIDIAQHVNYSTVSMHAVIHSFVFQALVSS